MSTLIKEDNDWLYLTRYIHDEPDSYSDWEVDDQGERYRNAVHLAENGAFYEVKATYRINKITGEVIYDSFNGT